MIRRPLRTDRRGAATIEFAMWSVLVLVTLLAALDIGMFVIERGRVSQAIGGASIAAFKNRSEVNYAAIPAYVRAASGSRRPDAMAVTVTCNGSANCTNGNRVCACLSKTATFVAAGSCGQSCGAGSTPNSLSGYYMQIRATQPYDPIMMPRGTLAGEAILQVATVRLQ